MCKKSHELEAPEEKNTERMYFKDKPMMCPVKFG